MKTLELKFLNEEDKVVTLTLDDPVEPADPAAVNAAMDEIINQNCFYSSGGILIGKKEARIVERNVVDIEI
ncbi:DUF2922 domain-containing protein [Halobacillus sp. ACCC02827]|uniref:DUF2922 domain-containing protein n=1 Tax=Bacillaceae TaxID=186817 RepID=UPI0002A4EF37|nr:MULTISPECIES: DUF2922 domain-containing protein [Bacillaceae]ELK44584.1 hypothetical protein D479_18519 [Halobacillus sp. BAB-2008]QHT46465.1 DUF2922 domain-containing protein [Bacillus sp. SB49]WJE17275.1 DUF2922 domain-containing protein [Halobacillus sp. ACCC02827]